MRTHGLGIWLTRALLLTFAALAPAALEAAPSREYQLEIRIPVAAIRGAPESDPVREIDLYKFYTAYVKHVYRLEATRDERTYVEFQRLLNHAFDNKPSRLSNKAFLGCLPDFESGRFPQGVNCLAKASGSAAEKQASGGNVMLANALAQAGSEVDACVRRFAPGTGAGCLVPADARYFCKSPFAVAEKSVRDCLAKFERESHPYPSRAAMCMGGYERSSNDYIPQSLDCTKPIQKSDKYEILPEHKKDETGTRGA